MRTQHLPTLEGNAKRHDPTRIIIIAAIRYTRAPHAFCKPIHSNPISPPVEENRQELAGFRANQLTRYVFSVFFADNVCSRSSDGFRASFPASVRSRNQLSRAVIREKKTTPALAKTVFRRVPSSSVNERKKKKFKKIKRTGHISNYGANSL